MISRIEMPNETNGDELLFGGDEFVFDDDELLFGGNFDDGFLIMSLSDEDDDDGEYWLLILAILKLTSSR